ncbi:uncharacterized protein METZ01_LOCUS503623 [marine metagenome]|jgi:hypothetical protein|uniref:Uncharacterized protein n=1 Tax=marine metagenome TaxID=408172 RepID=A0A383E2E0_9ZZZZ|tara:strand:- start:447 stop:548 length:102 start_codon:yes stop_codon:yes gene_type:complete
MEGGEKFEKQLGLDQLGLLFNGDPQIDSPNSAS